MKPTRHERAIINSERIEKLLLRRVGKIPGRLHRILPVFECVTCELKGDSKPMFTEKSRHYLKYHASTALRNVKFKTRHKANAYPFETVETSSGGRFVPTDPFEEEYEYSPFGRARAATVDVENLSSNANPDISEQDSPLFVGEGCMGGEGEEDPAPSVSSRKGRTEESRCSTPEIADTASEIAKGTRKLRMKLAALETRRRLLDQRHLQMQEDQLCQRQRELELADAETLCNLRKEAAKRKAANLMEVLQKRLRHGYGGMLELQLQAELLDVKNLNLRALKYRKK